MDRQISDDGRSIDIEGTRALAGPILAGIGGLVRVPHLLIVEGPAAGDRLAVIDGAVLGRGKGADLRLRDPTTSRRHLRFTIRDGTTCVENLGSKNGVTVDGRSCVDSPRPLVAGSVIALGQSLLVYGEGARKEPPPPVPAEGATRAVAGGRAAHPVAAAVASSVALLVAATLLSLAAFLWD